MQTMKKDRVLSGWPEVIAVVRTVMPRVLSRYVKYLHFEVKRIPMEDYMKRPLVYESMLIEWAKEMKESCKMETAAWRERISERMRERYRRVRTEAGLESIRKPTEVQRDVLKLMMQDNQLVSRMDHNGEFEAYVADKRVALTTIHRLRKHGWIKNITPDAARPLGSRFEITEQGREAVEW